MEYPDLQTSLWSSLDESKSRILIGVSLVGPATRIKSIVESGSHSLSGKEMEDAARFIDEISRYYPGFTELNHQLAAIAVRHIFMSDISRNDFEIEGYMLEGVRNDKVIKEQINSFLRLNKITDVKGAYKNRVLTQIIIYIINMVQAYQDSSL